MRDVGQEYLATLGNGVLRRVETLRERRLEVGECVSGKIRRYSDRGDGLVVEFAVANEERTAGVVIPVLLPTWWVQRYEEHFVFGSELTLVCDPGYQRKHRRTGELYFTRTYRLYDTATGAEIGETADEELATDLGALFGDDAPLVSATRAAADAETPATNGVAHEPQNPVGPAPAPVVPTDEPAAPVAQHGER